MDKRPADSEGLRRLGAALRLAGDHDEAERAELDAIAASIRDPALMTAAEALVENRLNEAERILRPRLKEQPFDVAAIRMMGELAARLGRLVDAETLFRRALELAPAFTAARANLAAILVRLNRPTDAIKVLDRLLDADPGNAGHQNLMAAALGRIGDYEDALGLYEKVLALVPGQPKVWMSYGHVLKTVGRQPDAVAAYRKAISLSPRLGEAWWSLANLKTVKLGADDIAALSDALARPDLTVDDRFHLHFALGKAADDGGQAAEAFGHYAEANRLRRAMIRYDPAEVGAHVARCRALFTPTFFAGRAGWGCEAPDPVFIVGLPRAGSTLIEQMLASHKAIEGTIELPDLPAIARRLGGPEDAYPECLANLSAADCAALGAEYLERTRIHRKTRRAYFIDKLPNNWMHVGLIRLILPNAKIIDARRHPLDCGVSNFRQHYARGQAFSYALDDIGFYYRDYAALMAHFDCVLPGRVHRVIHEALVADPEAVLRRLLRYIGLRFEADCLRFHENARAVGTASSEQVRRPINRDGMDQWRRYDPWLGPLRNALGPVLDDYPPA